MAYGEYNPFSISFTTLKIRYQDYDKSIDNSGFLCPGDKVNVFINFESVLNNLSFLKDIENKLLLERNFPFILESEAINLCAHYKRFFRDNGLITRVFLYYTDLTSIDYLNFKYNDEFRSYYENKFLRNPKYQMLGNRIVDVIVPRIKKIVEFIPQVYFISATNFDASLIPKIVSDLDPSYKNFIISTDKCDTQYQLMDRFMMHYIRRGATTSAVTSTLNETLNQIFKENLTGDNEADIYRNSSLFSTLWSSIGSKSRSVEPLKGIGAKTLSKKILSGIADGIITKDSTSLELISHIFEDELVEQLISNFHCLDIHSQYNDLSDSARYGVQSQIIDRSDFNSLIRLNQEDYCEYPLMLEELTK